MQILAEDIPLLSDLNAIRYRLSDKDFRDRYEDAADFAVFLIKAEIDSFSKSGSLRDSVKFDFESDSIIIDSPYVAIQNYGGDLKETSLFNKVIPIKTEAGLIFRTVSDTPTVTGKNWVIPPKNFIEVSFNLLRARVGLLSTEDAGEISFKDNLYSEDFYDEDSEDSIFDYILRLIEDIFL